MVVQTRVATAVFRLLVALLLLFVVPLIGIPQDAEEWLISTISLAGGVFFTVYRFWERAVLDSSGITLTSVPLGIGPIPFITRVQHLPWGSLTSVRTFYQAAPLTMYHVDFSFGGKKERLVLGIHMVNYRSALDMMVRRASKGVVEEDILRRVQKWRQRGRV